MIIPAQYDSELEFSNDKSSWKIWNMEKEGEVIINNTERYSIRSGVLVYFSMNSNF